MTKPNMNEIWELLEALIRQAGAEILEVYNSDNHELEYKDDNSPLTKADRGSHDILMAGLEKLTPDIPIMSEEAPFHANLEVMESDYYWCIDPLDGTAEFANRRDEFAINMGLIGPDGPVAGMVYAPVFDDLFWGEVGGVAQRNLRGSVSQISVSSRTKAKYVVSRSHVSEDAQSFLDKLGDFSLKKYGSALKFTAVASGEADMYPRFAPDMEWDSAAPHAIVLAAGGRILGFDGEELKYRKDGLLNKGYICYNGRIDLPDFKVQ